MALGLHPHVEHLGSTPFPDVPALHDFHETAEVTFGHDGEVPRDVFSQAGFELWSKTFATLLRLAPPRRFSGRTSKLTVCQIGDESPVTANQVLGGHIHPVVVATDASGLKASTFMTRHSNGVALEPYEVYLVGGLTVLGFQYPPASGSVRRIITLA